MKRREFIAGLGSAAAWPLVARAEQPSVPVIGFLGLSSAKANAPYTAWFGRGLNEAGFTEGQNVIIQYRWADGHYDRLPSLATQMVRDHVAIIFASGGTPPTMAAVAATDSIPIVFSVGEDPVKQGLVPSINRPGGNVTGVTFTSTPLGAKRLELLRELNPKAALVGLLVNPNSVAAEGERRQLELLALLWQI